MNPLQRIRKKRHILVFSSVVAILACVSALSSNYLMLDPGTRDRILASTIVTSLSIGFVFAYLVGRKVVEVNRLTSRLDYLASFDFLTGAMTRAKFFSQISSMRDRSGAILVFDMDKFKLINDTLGHAAGDAALFKVAMAARRNLGPRDCLCRMGGDEFCAFFPGVDLQEARTVAQWIKQRIANETVGEPGSSIHLSASFGVAMLTSAADIDAAIAVADAELYHAKANRPRLVPQMTADQSQLKSGQG